MSGNLIREEENEYLVQKSRSMIHRTHFPSVLQEKTFNALLLAAKVAYKSSQTNPDAYYKEGFFTTRKFICNFSGARKKDLDYLTEVVVSLSKNVLRFDFFNEDEKLIERRLFPPISELRFLEDGRVNFFLPKTIIEAIANPDSNYSVNTYLAGRLTSVYAIAIYEMGLIHMGGRVRFSLTQFREYMGLKPEEYPKSFDLKRYVIDKGCDEVNIKCGIVVDYNLIKEGKGGKVTGIEFSFSPSADPIEIPSDYLQLELIGAFCNSFAKYLSPDQHTISILKKGLDSHGEEWVLSNVEAFIKCFEPGAPPVKNPAALFRACFDNDYGKSVRDFKAVAKIIKKQKQGEGGEQLSFETSDLDLYLQKKARYLAHFNSLKKTEQKRMLTEIENHVPRIAGPQEEKIVFYLSEVLQVEV